MNTNLKTFAAIASLVALSTFTANTAIAAANTSPTSWELAGEFHPTANPNPTGVWSYGTKLGSTCNTSWSPMTHTFLQGPLRGHAGIAAGTGPQVPAIYHNRLLASHTSGSVTWAPRAVAMHPGPGGECAVVRFKAPTAGFYQVSGQFYGLDGNGTGTNVNVHVMYNKGTTVTFHSAVVKVIGGNRMSSFRKTGIYLVSGESFDFAVEMNGSYFYDTTGLHAVVELDPYACGPTNPADPTTTTC